MIFSSRKVYELYQRYSEQALEILHRSSCDLTVEERRQIWDEIWEEAMRRKRELRHLKSEEEKLDTGSCKQKDKRKEIER